ncbi:uncharacterized protein LOC125217161 [Salvia hispanica]|uniref:uncharacterized protein LOC125217159 n=1 Tax=Salvia hispanica TaxID=49212 RepID=UPI00200993C2|nr:uncharacterized protein LOC125217159 [Salvia hispanica]XP_047974953.1 uncharacterized protein LOC125217161 [Salvia hispanica]
MEADVSDNFHFCKICGLPILSAPSYTCPFVACDFFLHESCAGKIQEELILPNLKDHTLSLQVGSPNFIYQCDDCDVKMHPLDAAAAAAAVDGVEIKTIHKSHPPHPLVVFCRQILSHCDACGERHDGFFFSCQQCNFWIHQDCTILPTALNLLSIPWPFLLAHSIRTNYEEIECVVCDKSLLHTHNAVYLCPQTLRVSHVRCALEKIHSKTRLELIQLPDDEFDTFPSLEIRTYSQRNQADIIGDDEDKKLAMENFHEHPLILVGDEAEDHSYNHKKLVCDICIQTITIPSPFYRCSLQGGCSFLAHKVCAGLFPIINFQILDDSIASTKAEPCPYPDKWFFSSIFLCVFCCLPSNSPCYYYPEEELTPLMFDLSCMAAPNIIKHSSHSQHLLFRTTRTLQFSLISCCSRGSTIHDVYRCTMCHFLIHIRCALLPKMVHFRKFDQHPLHLITTSTINGSDHDICEVCEEDVECKYWFYHCAECDYSFHVNCIPSLGYLSKVKFGGKYSMPCHSHPLTLRRMLTYGRNERCGYCNQKIPGLVDQVAFFCSQCDYWIHFSCARDSFTYSQNCKSLIFEEIDAQEWYDMAETED